MPSDNDHLTAGQAARSDDATATVPTGTATEQVSAEARERVEHVNAYLKKAASNGVWSAIE